MKGQWQRIVVKLTVWLAVELLLNLVGLDNLANYGEFVLGDSPVVQPPHRDVPTLVLAKMLSL